MAANLRMLSASTLQLYPHNPWLLAPCTCRRPQAATRKVKSRSQAPSQHAAVFESLAGLLCPSDIPITLGVTKLGRGIVASSDIQPGTVLLTLDAFSTLCVVDEPKRTGDAFGAAVMSDWQSVWAIELPAALVRYLSSSRGKGSWFMRLMAWLLWLKRHASDHPVWQMYLQLLPQEGGMCSLMNYTPDERPELQLPHLIQLAEKERSSIKAVHDSLFSSTTGELRALDLAPDFNDTLWAACMVNSRCFSDAAGRELLSLMVPLADMANHSNEPNAGFKLNPGTQIFSIISTKAIAAGEEVLISYLGEIPNKSSADLMKDYGFMMPGNLNDVIELEGRDDDQQQLISPGLLMQASAAAAAQAAESDPDTAAQKRRIQAVMKSLQQFVAQPASQPVGSSSSDAGAVEPQGQLVQHLVQQCQEHLARLPTSIDQDKQLLGSPAAQESARLQAAILARLEHKQLLATAIDVLQQYHAVQHV